MNQYRNTYLEEFPMNEEGFLLVDDPELIEALRRRAERKRREQDALVHGAHDTLEPS